MSWWRRVCAATGVAAFVFCCVCAPFGSVRASDNDEARVLLFSGRDIWGNGAFAYGGFIFAPRGLDENGLLLKVMLSGGLYRYNAQKFNGERVVGAEALAQVLPGWRIKRGNTELKIFMGPEIQRHRLRPDDPDNRLRGISYGLRVAAEIWCEPTPNTMIAGDVALSSIATSNAARVAYGWRVLEEMLGGLYVGPEIQYFGSDGYRHTRLGVHITSMKTEDTEWSAAVGWARDSGGRSSPYVRLSILTRR